MRALPFSTLRKYIVTLAVFLLVGGIGYRLGERNVRLSVTPDQRIIVNAEPPASLSSVDFSLFWDVWQRLTRSYIDRASIDVEKMVWGAIGGMVSSLGDPYTVFLPPKENREFKEDLGGEFDGIGAQLGLKDGRIIIVAPLRGTPAEKAGLAPGDIILKVNDEETAGWTIPQAVSKIRGPKGSTVNLEILHKDAEKPVEVVIARATITVPSVEWWVKQPRDITEISGVELVQTFESSPRQIAYLQLSRFGDHTNDDWNKAVAGLVAAQRTNGSLAGLILDLRNNPGGYLDGSVFIASEFLESGTVVSQVNSDETREDFSVNRRGKLLDIPLIVLVNQGSASASEIVAGALKDYGRATIVGEKTFGKGSVQTPFDLTRGAGLHVTTGKWLLPKGASINKEGITPDIEIALTSTEATQDGQLAKAVELLLK